MQQDSVDYAARPTPDDQLSVATPELVAIEFPLAGLGSRFVAILLDYLLQALAVFFFILVLVLLLPGQAGRNLTQAGNGLSAKWSIAIMIAVPFLLMWGYFTLFETFWRGQTPGKRIMKIRVIQQTGRPISLFESMGRNLLRFVDWLPAFYFVGVVSLFVTRRQQRLGDLISGTLVVHERPLETPLESIGSSRTFTFAAMSPDIVPVLRESKLPADAVARLTMADLQALEQYLARRLDVPMATREALANKIAQSIVVKMNYSIPEGMKRETFLEEAAYALRSMPNLRH